MRLNPIDIIMIASRRIPAAKYILFATSILSVIALAQGWKISPTRAIYGGVIIIGFMFVLLCFAVITEKRGNTALYYIGITVSGFMAVLLIISIALVMACVFFDRPKLANHLFGYQTAPVTVPRQVVESPGANSLPVQFSGIDDTRRQFIKKDNFWFEYDDYKEKEFSTPHKAMREVGFMLEEKIGYILVYDDDRRLMLRLPTTLGFAQYSDVDGWKSIPGPR
jgi:phosphate/sulfate permease